MTRKLIMRVPGWALLAFGFYASVTGHPGIAIVLLTASIVLFMYS